jgi:hypothetical protein
LKTNVFFFLLVYFVFQPTDAALDFNPLLRTRSSSPANAKPRVGRWRSLLNLPDETKPLSNRKMRAMMNAAFRAVSKKRFSIAQ